MRFFPIRALRSLTLPAGWARALFVLAWVSMAAANRLPAASVPGETSNLPASRVTFEPGPTDLPHSFLARGAEYLFVIEPTRAAVLLNSKTRKQGGVQEARVMRFNLSGANPAAVIQGENAHPGVVNYLVGDRSQWRTHLALHDRVSVRNVYPGIDMVYYGNGHRLEYDFNVSAGANPREIAIHYDGVASVGIDRRGDLVVKSGSEELRQPRPEVYQLINGVRQKIEASYLLKDSRTVGFALGHYDSNQALVIDPMLSYSTFFGGNHGDTAYGIKVDADGSIYLAGETLSTAFAFPLSTNVQASFGGGRVNGDAFVAKLGPGGTNLVYFTYVGGSGNEGARDLAIDAAGHAFITGFTDSTNFPIVLPGGPVFGLTNHINGVRDRRVRAFRTDAFIAELETDGATLVYSAYLGGTSADIGVGIALDPDGNAYITGFTYSTNFPVVNGCQTVMRGINDLFISKIAPLGSALLYSTYLGGTNVDEGEGIAVDSAGNAYVTGFTLSTNFPVTALAAQPQLSGSTNATFSYRRRRVPPTDAIIVRVDTTQTGAPSLTYASYLGGTNNDYGYRIALDGDSNIYVTGNATSTNFPNFNHAAVIAAGALPKKSVNSDAFLTKFHFLAADNAAPVYSILFGGALNDTGWGVTVDAAQNAYVVGYTSSKDFPTNNTFGFLRGTNAGLSDVFVAAFDANASNVLYSAYLGGKSDDFGYGIAVDSVGQVYVAGRTVSTNFPMVAPPGFAPLQTARNGTNDAFVAIIAPNLPAPALTYTPLGEKSVLFQWPYAPEYTLEGAAGPNGTDWLALPGIPVLTNGWNFLEVEPSNPAGPFRLKR